jgi:hypothetical protein
MDLIIEEIVSLLDRDVREQETRFKIVEAIFECYEDFFNNNFQNYKICKLINTITNYLDIRPQQEFNSEWNKNQEIKHNEIPVGIIPYGGNYYREKNQKIFKSDIENNKILNSYQQIADSIIQKMKDCKDKEELYKYKKYLKSLKDDMRLLKDYLYGTIYFKNIKSSSDQIEPNKFDLDLFEEEDCRILLLILPFSKVSENVSYHIEKFEKIKPYLKLNSNQQELLEILENGKEDRYYLLNQKDSKKAVFTNQDLSEILTKHKNHMSKLFKSLVSIVCNAYIDWYTDNIYYIYVRKGEYKQCKICKEFKIKQMFHMNKTGKFGVGNVCKNCKSSKNRLQIDNFPLYI